MKIIIGDSHLIVSFIIPPKGFLLIGKNYRMLGIPRLPIFYFLLLPPSSFSGLAERLHSLLLGYTWDERLGGGGAGLHCPLEVLLVLQAKPPPNVDHSGPQKKKSSERSVEPNPYLDFTPIMYTTSFPGGNWVGRRNKKRLLTENTQCEDARQCQPWWGAAGVPGGGERLRLTIWQPYDCPPTSPVSWTSLETPDSWHVASTLFLTFSLYPYNHCRCLEGHQQEARYYCVKGCLEEHLNRISLSECREIPGSRAWTQNTIWDLTRKDHLLFVWLFCSLFKYVK